MKEIINHKTLDTLERERERERERESGNLNKLNIKEKARQKAYINIGFLSCFFNVYKKIDFYPEHMWIFCIKQ